MQKDKPKTDASVKAGLQIEGGHDHPENKKTGTSFPTGSVEQDLDEVVHEQGGITTDKEAENSLTEEEDMDELVHRRNSR